MIFFHFFQHKILYKIFLHIHQALVASFFYFIQHYLSLGKIFSCIYLYIFFGMFLAILLFETGNILYWNYTVYSGYLQVFLILDSKLSISMVTVNIYLSKLLQVKAGQYINLWVPSVSVQFFLQSHLFVIISWIKGKQNNLQLIVELCKGLSRKLLYYSKNNRSCFVLLSNRNQLMSLEQLHFAISKKTHL